MHGPGAVSHLERACRRRCPDSSRSRCCPPTRDDLTQDPVARDVPPARRLRRHRGSGLRQRRRVAATAHLAKLTVLVPAPIDAGEDGLHIAHRLASNAGSNTRQGTLPRCRNGLATFLAVGKTCTGRYPSACVAQCILDGVVDLLLNCAVWRPTISHACLHRWICKGQYGGALSLFHVE